MRNLSLHPLSGSNPNNRYVNELRAHARKTTAMQGRGIKLQQTSRGTIIKATPGSPGGSVVGIVFRGEWNGGRQYAQSDAVKISSGIAAGFYVATKRPTVGEQPWTGTNWTLLAKLFDQWL